MSASTMSRSILAAAIRSAPAALALAAALAGPPALARPAAAPVVLALDAPSQVNGLAVACTGIGQTRLDPRWQAYSVRVEFSNARNEYLAGGAIVVRDRAGRELVSLSCDSPWVLLRLPAGSYRVEGRAADSAAAPRSARFDAPATGQLRVVLQFPEA